MLAFLKGRKFVFLEIGTEFVNFFLSKSVNWWQYFTYKSPQEFMYVKTTVFTLKPCTRFSPQGTILRDYWYISWARSTKYMCRCKYQIKGQRIIRYSTATQRIIRCSLIWYLHLDMIWLTKCISTHRRWPQESCDI
jgi:hypothetical protein